MAEMMDLYNEAENSVLGTLIADAEVNASLVFTRVRPEDFVTGISRQIFETCRAMYGRGDVIDPLTVKAVSYTHLIFAVSDSVLLHRRLHIRSGRHDSAARFFCTLYRTAPAD